MAFKMKAGKEGPMRKNFGKDIAPMNFNAGLRAASKAGKLDNNPKFKAAVDNAPTKMVTQGGYTGKGEKKSIHVDPKTGKISIKGGTHKDGYTYDAKKNKEKIRKIVSKVRTGLDTKTGKKLVKKAEDFSNKFIGKDKTKKIKSRIKNVGKQLIKETTPVARQTYKAVKKDLRTGNITKQIKGIAKDIKKDDVFKMKKKESPKKILGSLMGPLGGMAAKALGNKKVRKGIGKVGGTMLQALGGPLGGMAGKAMGGMLMKKAPNKMKKKK